MSQGSNPRRARRAILLVLALLALLLLSQLLRRALPYAVPLAKSFGELRWLVETSGEYSLPHHTIAIDTKMKTISARKGESEIWSTPAGKSFLGASTGRLDAREHRGSFYFHYQDIENCQNQTVVSIAQAQGSVQVNGTLLCADKERVWRLLLSENQNTDLVLQFTIDPQLDRIYWRAHSPSNEHYFGGGEQFTYFDLKGHVIPIWVSEQGIGRGLQPLTFLVNLLAQSGGTPVATYLSSAQVLTSGLRAFHRQGARYGEFDFRQPGEVVFDYWDHTAEMMVIQANSPKELLRSTSTYTGRMRALPDWIHSGVILGLQGGTERVRELVKRLADDAVPIAGVWIQDWVGQRTTKIGKQLWWNWELNGNHYPGWTEFTSDLKTKNIKLLGYVNPYLVALPDDSTAKRRLLTEAREHGYLLKDKNGDTLDFKITSFSAAMIDLSNPKAFRWFKSVLKEQLVTQGFTGWMADFAEALPFEAKLSEGEARDFHNLYPVKWAQVNREAIDELPNASDFVFFTRSGFSNSPAYSTLFWTGDQTVTWDEFDGLKTALTSLLSSGLSGATLNHSDIGGYTSFALPVFSLVRSEELLIRWMELNAFTAVFRTHEGNQRENNVQVYDTRQTRAAFAKNAQLFKSLFAYRKKAIAEAAVEGWPVVRPMWLEFPGETEVLTNHRQFMLGSEILVAPVLEPGKTTVDVFLPKGRWQHLLTGEEFDVSISQWRNVSAPIGQPAAFLRQ